MVAQKIHIFAYILLEFFILIDAEAKCLNTFSGQNAPSPINIDSSKIIPVKTTTPLTLFNVLFDTQNLTNTGKTLESITNQVLDPTYITGGILCNKIYKIHTIRFYISQDVNSRSGNTVDGRGTPLEMTVIYYNILYGSMKNALKFPDGITVFGFPVKVDTLPNSSFKPLQAVLSTGAVKKPHSSIPVPSLSIYVWFDNLPVRLFNEYYAYKGSYYDPETGTQIAPANYLFVSPKQALSMSHEQYAVFKNVLGLNGKPLNSAPPIHPQGSTKVYKSRGIVEVLLPLL